PSKNRSGRSRGEINWMPVAEDATQKSTRLEKGSEPGGVLPAPRRYAPVIHTASGRVKENAEACRHVALERPTLYAHARIRAQTPENIRLSASSQNAKSTLSLACTVLSPSALLYNLGPPERVVHKLSTAPVMSRPSHRHASERPGSRNRPHKRRCVAAQSPEPANGMRGLR